MFNPIVYAVTPEKGFEKKYNGLDAYGGLADPGSYHIFSIGYRSERPKVNVSMPFALIYKHQVRSKYQKMYDAFISDYEVENVRRTMPKFFLYSDAGDIELADLLRYHAAENHFKALNHFKSSPDDIWNPAFLSAHLDPSGTKFKTELEYWADYIMILRKYISISVIPWLDYDIGGGILEKDVKEMTQPLNTNSLGEDIVVNESNLARFKRLSEYGLVRVANPNDELLRQKIIFLNRAEVVALMRAPLEKINVKAGSSVKTEIKKFYDEKAKKMTPQEKLEFNKSKKFYQIGIGLAAVIFTGAIIGAVLSLPKDSKTDSTENSAQDESSQLNLVTSNPEITLMRTLANLEKLLWDTRRGFLK